MKALRIIIVLVSLAIIVMLQGCGGGGGTTDTAGALTMTTPTAKDEGGKIYSVTTTITYAPPAGKSAQGVVVSTTASDSSGTVQSSQNTLTSGSNSVILTFYFKQYSVPNHVSIASSIGGMTASVGATIPAVIVPLTVTPATVSFLATDYPDNTVSTPITISGGTAPYTVVSSAPTEINATVSGSSLSITLLIPVADSFLPVKSSATVTVTDSTAIKQTQTITVSYFK